MAPPVQPHPPDRPDAPQGRFSGRATGNLRRWVPLIGWVAASDRDSRRSDVVAGLTVATMLIPQAMAYAALAGMPPVTGLYAATVPLVAYAVFGTSGQLAFGPVALVSLLTASTLAPLADGDPGRYIALAGILALLVGVLQLGLGVLRAGRLTALLSRPVVSGFTSAAAIVIATSQLDTLLGIDVEQAGNWPQRLAGVLTEASAAHAPTLAVGAAAIVALVVGRRLRTRLPVTLAVVALATTVVPLIGLEALGVAVLGEIPRGMPTPTLPTAPLTDVVAMLPGATVIALISYLEGISVARAIAARTRARIDPDQELIAAGAANLAAGLVQAFPVAGGFSRTAVNHTAGARSPMATLVTAATVLLAVLLFAPWFRTLPQAVLAAVVIVAVATLVDVREALHAWRVEPTDGAALTVTFVATLVLGVEVGIGVGIAASFVLSIWRVSGRDIRVEEGGDRRVVHVEGELLAASGVRLRDVVEDVLADGDVGSDVEVIELDLSGVPGADLSGIQALTTLDAACTAAGVRLELAGVREGLFVLLRRADLVERFTGRLVVLGDRHAGAAVRPTPTDSPDGR